MTGSHRPVRRFLGHAASSQDEPTLPDDRATLALQSLIRTRLASERLESLQANGDIGFHPPTAPAATAAIATAEALGTGWLFCSNRHLAAFLHRGGSFEDYFDHVFGNGADAAQGHQMPGFFSARPQRIVAAAPTQGALTQAVGFSWAAHERNERIGVASLFGGAGVDSAEFHSALNFAGVLRAPVVFVAVSRGLRQPPISDVGVAYGVPSTACDGSDVYALYHTIRAALETRGPHLVEALLEPEHDGERRLREHLEALGRWSHSKQTETETAVAEALDRATAQASRRGEPETNTLFNHVFARIPPLLDAQAKDLRQTARRRTPRDHE